LFFFLNVFQYQINNLYRHLLVLLLLLTLQHNNKGNILCAVQFRCF
jgi:hypothetical protein